MTERPLRLLILGAHPDDAEFHAGGLATRYCQAGHVVRMVSVTDGRAGHQLHPAEQLVKIRRREAAAAGAVIGAEYVTWDNPDGALLPSLALRHQIIREIRQFAPDLVLTHRTNDYHPDHRAVGQAVQDASYMVTVPGVVPDVPILNRDPVVAYLVDLFTKPSPFEPDVIIDVDDCLDTIVAMLSCHVSQVFEFLPFNQGILDQVPATETDRRAWLSEWYRRRVSARADRFRNELIAAYGDSHGREVQICEAYEISEYAAGLEPATRQRLFPGSL